MAVGTSAPAQQFDLHLTDPADPRLGALCGVGKYWCWSQSYSSDAPPLRLLEWTHGGIVDLATPTYSLHVVKAGTPHLIEGLFDYWLTSDADHVWVQVPRSDRRYYVLIAGGRTGVNLRHQLVWRCQTCGEALAARELAHDGTPAEFLRAQAEAAATFSADLQARTCGRCGAVHGESSGFAAPPGDVVSSGTEVGPEAHPPGVAFGEPAARLRDLHDREPVAVIVGGQEIVIFRDGAHVYATDGRCPHRGGPLVEGEVRDRTITCPWHRFRYDARSGACVTNPALRVPTYHVTRRDEDVVVTNTEIHEEDGKT